MGNDWENSDSASVSSNSEYEADDESYQGKPVYSDSTYYSILSILYYTL